MVACLTSSCITSLRAQCLFSDSRLKNGSQVDSGNDVISAEELSTCRDHFVLRRTGDAMPSTMESHDLEGGIQGLNIGMQ